MKTQWVSAACSVFVFSIAACLMAAFPNRIYIEYPWRAIGFAAIFVVAVSGVVIVHLLDDIS